MPEGAVLQKDLLRVSDLHAWYGESHILHGMDFTVAFADIYIRLCSMGIIHDVRIF